MGYYTRYELKTTKPVSLEIAKDVAAKIDSFLGFDPGSLRFNDSYTEKISREDPDYAAEYIMNKRLGSDMFKWYDCTEDMETVSASYPDVVFELYAWGEDRDDIWKAIFKNGDSCECYASIVYKDPPEEFLKKLN